MSYKNAVWENSRRLLVLIVWAAMLGCLWWTGRVGSAAFWSPKTEIPVSPVRPAKRPTSQITANGKGTNDQSGANPLATFTVTNANDSGVGSLRQAVTDANANGPGADDINFDLTFFATQRTITLTSGELSSNSNLTINGPGAHLLTVSGNSTSRVFNISGSVTVNLIGVTVTGGNNSGINNGIGGNLTVNNCVVTGNTGLFGGGIDNLNATLTVLNSTVSNNIANGSGAGGGINHFAGTLSVTNSTISGNRVNGGTGSGGGVRNGGNGTATITNSTITNNTSAGGGGSAGGVFRNAGTVTLRNSIIAANVNNTTQPDVTANSGVGITSNGFNLIGNRGAVPFDGTGDQSGTGAAPLNPQLGPLANNGGTTQTHPLLAGSPALDKGNSSGATTDQRGAARPFDIAGIAPAADGDNADIGAVEMQARIVTNANDDGAGSLRQALTEASGNGPGQDDIIFDNTVFNAAQSINLASPLPDITTDLSINGPGANLLTVRRDANLAGIYRVFNIPDADFNIAMSGLTIRDGKANGFGGGIFSFSRLTLTNCALVNNETSSFTGGGGVFLGSDGTFTNCVFGGNTGGLQGGGINFQGDDGRVLRLINSTVSGNRVLEVGFGGGILNASLSGNSTLEVVNSTIVNNTIVSPGDVNTGGIYTFSSNGGSNATTTLRNSIVANNDAPNLRVSASGGSAANITSQGFNLSNNGNGFLTQTTDKTAPPLLGLLADNGGPTQTHSLLGGSPALDAGSSSGVLTDQRGLLRPFDIAGIAPATGGDNADIGAFEAQSAPLPTPTPTPTATPTPTPPPPPLFQFTLRNFVSNENTGGATITVGRFGDTAPPVSVDYRTDDNFAFADCAANSGQASQRCDYTSTQGTLNFAAGEMSKTFTVPLTDDFYVEGNETVALTLFNPLGLLGSPSTATLTINDDDTTAPAERLFLARLNAAQEVPTNNSTATGFGTVALNQTETQITVNMSFSGLSSAQTAAHIHGAAHVGVNAPVIFNLGTGTITNAVFAVTPAQVAQLKAGLFYFNVHTANFPGGEIRGQILSNPLESARFFVRQQYHDFLSRPPDQAGEDFWTGQIANVAGTDLNAIKLRRVAVSNAFFFEQEYQQTGAYVFRLYRAAFGNTQPFPNTMGDMDSNPFCQANPNNCQLIRAAHVPSYERFAGDRARLDAGNLAATQLALATQFAQRVEFTVRYPVSQTAEQFVDALLGNIQAASGANLTSQRAALIALFNSGGRGAVLFRLAEDNTAGNPVNNRPFIDAEYNRAFVTTQYFGYLRRDADMPGLNFWLSVVNQFPLRDAAGQSGMVCAFITSGEYQQRFNSYFTRTNQTDCP